MDSTHEPNPQTFSALDESLRCRICSDYFDIPTSLKCGHCYCSQCIRGHIAVQMENKLTPMCPICRSECDPSHVTPQHTLRQIVKEFLQVRPLLTSTPASANASTSYPDQEQQHMRCEKRTAPGCWQDEQPNKRAKGLLVKPKLPPRLFFKDMSVKQVEKALAGLGLSAHGKKNDMVSKYQAFRRYVETAIDGGRTDSIKTLAKEFNTNERKEQMAKCWKKFSVGNEVKATSFKDLISVTRSRMEAAKQLGSGENEMRRGSNGEGQGEGTSRMDAIDCTE